MFALLVAWTETTNNNSNNKAHIENYRPISLMCVVAKVLSRALYLQYRLKSLQHLDAGKLRQRRMQWTRQGRRMHAKKPRHHRVQDAVSIGRVPKDAVMKQ